MKRCFDPDFKYKPSFETDVRKTFERIRREQKAKAEAAAASTVRRLPFKKEGK